VVAADGAALATFGGLYGEPVRVAGLPPYLPQAVLAVEDRRFYGHFGIDPLGLARAAIANVRAGHIVQGGSTITQQLAKNLFLTPERTLKRKIQETLLAFWLERKFAKDQILSIYLNRVYLGAGAYGVDAAATKYFGKPASRVSLYEAALLAGLLKAPSRYAPTQAADLARARARLVLASMVKAGYITEAQAEEARANPARFAPRPGAEGGRYFADWIIDQLSGFVGHVDEDLVVSTTLDPRLQRIAEAEVEAMLSGPGKAANVGQAALVVLSPSGAVRAMVGGRNYGASQFNRATQALRQPGSAFKLFVYLAALERGLGPATRTADAPLQVSGWTPRNYDGKYLGQMSLGQALALSRNTVAVRVAEKVGRNRVVAVARRLGITTELEARPSLALGAAEVTLIELTAAYAALANKGAGVWAHGIKEVRDRQGRILYRRRGSGPGRVIAPDDVAAMTGMLVRVIAEGTGKAAALGRPAAGKTGTSQDFRDAWFVGYTADLVAGVWLGNDDETPMKKVTGGGLPAKLWRAVMAEAHEGRPARPLPAGPAGPRAPAPPEQVLAREGAGRPTSPGFWDELLNRLGIGE
jgi:penicillin-binding protein 1A